MESDIDWGMTQLAILLSCATEWVSLSVHSERPLYLTVFLSVSPSVPPSISSVASARSVLLILFHNKLLWGKTKQLNDWCSWRLTMAAKSEFSLGRFQSSASLSLFLFHCFCFFAFLIFACCSFYMLMEYFSLSLHFFNLQTRFFSVG